MALTNTTLSAACTASDLVLKVTSTTSGFPSVGTIGSRQLMRVDGEMMLIDVVQASGIVKVLMRGYDGTIAVAHDTLSIVSTSATASDFGDVPIGGFDQRMPYVDDVVTIGQDLVFTVAGTAPVPGTSMPYPIKNTTYIITKATAAAITLIAVGATSPAPTAAQIGVVMTFVSGTAQAHTVTYGPGFLGDTTSSDIATSASKVGATFQCRVGYTGLLAPTNTGTGTGWTLG